RSRATARVQWSFSRAPVSRYFLADRRCAGFCEPLHRKKGAKLYHKACLELPPHRRAARSDVLREAAARWSGFAPETAGGPGNAAPPVLKSAKLKLRTGAPRA